MLNLEIIGGTPETQREFLESVSTDPSNRRPPDRGRKPPIANQFALGYTYQDVLDTDHEGNWVLPYPHFLQVLMDAYRHTRPPLPLPPRKSVALLHPLD